MANLKNTTASIPTPTHRTVYDRAPKPKAPRTPRREYSFMRTMVYIPQGGSFGPVGGVAQ